MLEQLNLMEVAETCPTDKKDHGYLEVYNEAFNDLKEKSVNFLEIGVYNGGSAKLWRKYFPNANIFMSDIFDKTDILQDCDVSFFLGDSGNTESLDKLMDFVEKETGRRELDVVIDDGSHFQYDQMNGIGNLFPHVSAGGLYVIEDICREESLRNGSMWWGHSGEPHHSIPGDCHAGSQLRTDEEWLAGDEIDYTASTDATIKDFLNTKVFRSKYLSDSKNQYITDNSESVGYFSREDGGLRCNSKLAIFKKR